MDADNQVHSKRKYLFNADILIEAESNGRALEKLLHILNSDDIKDYLIKEGIHLGKTIEIAMRETISKKKTMADGKEPLKQRNEGQAVPKNPAAAKETAIRESDEANQAIWVQFQQFKQNNTLIRLSVVKAKGIKLNLPCRILNADPASGNVSVYHVDEKQVYLFKINEIDNYTVNQ